MSQKEVFFGTASFKIIAKGVAHIYGINEFTESLLKWIRCDDDGL
jgi:hypothetical protein